MGTSESSRTCHAASIRNPQGSMLMSGIPTTAKACVPTPRERIPDSGAGGPRLAPPPQWSQGGSLLHPQRLNPAWLSPRKEKPATVEFKPIQKWIYRDVTWIPYEPKANIPFVTIWKTGSTDRILATGVWRLATGDYSTITTAYFKS